MKVKELNKDIMKAIRLTRNQLTTPRKYKLYGCWDGRRFLKKLKNVMNNTSSEKLELICDTIEKFVNSRSNQTLNRYPVGVFIYNLYTKDDGIIEMVIYIYINYANCIEDYPIMSAREFLDELLRVLEGMKEEDYNYKKDKPEIITKSIRKNGGLDQTDLAILKEIAYFRMLSKENKNLTDITFKFMENDCCGYYEDRCFTQFLEEELEKYNRWISELRESGKYDEDMKQCVEQLKEKGYDEVIQKLKTDNITWYRKLTDYQYAQTGNDDDDELGEGSIYICEVEELNNFIKRWDSCSINRILDIYGDYYTTNNIHHTTPMDIIDFAGYIIENLIKMDLSSIEIEDNRSK
jgi:hypothetical protein